MSETNMMILWSNLSLSVKSVLNVYETETLSTRYVWIELQ